MQDEFIQSITKIILRDLETLAQEIRLYPNDELLWIVKGNISNPAGNLCLHICGNLQHFIGHILGGSDYKRNRDAEFSMTNVPRWELYELISKTKVTVESTLNALEKNKLTELFPIEVLGHPMTTMFFLTHLSCHLNYHLGQVNYHRRME